MQVSKLFCEVNIFDFVVVCSKNNYSYYSVENCKADEKVFGSANSLSIGVPLLLSIGAAIIMI
jgi:hypothetical protein